MSIQRLQLWDFRNLAKLDIEASTGLNVLLGENGAGKTSVLEALAVVGRGRSFRSNRLADCIRRECSLFRIVLELISRDDQGERVDHRLGYERTRSDWTARLDGQDVKQLSELARALPVSIFEPSSQELISGAPDLRRRYLDWGLFHVEHQFLQLWREHDRILKQRNSALKKNSPDRIIHSIDQVYVPMAEKLHELRKQHVAQLREAWMEILPVLAPGLDGLDIEIRRGWKQELELAAVLEHGLAQDRQMGSTRSGAHRDDLSLVINGVKAQQMLSRGQQKISALMLILAQLHLWRGCLMHAPLILLDDLTSELDDAHAGRVLDWLLESQLQTWISAVAWPDVFTERVEQAGGRMFHVEQGKVLPVL